MAKRDIVQYYLEQQSIYFELLENIKDIEPEIKEGRVPEEVVEQLKKDIEVTKENYERLSYIIFLLNKPNKAKKKKKEERMNAEYYNYLDANSSKEAVLNESKDCLADFKKIVKEVKEYDN